MLLAFNSMEWIVGFWATLAAGAVVVLANAWWSEAELQHALGVVDVDLVLADPRSAKLVPAGVPVLELEEMVAQAAGAPAVAPPRLRPGRTSRPSSCSRRARAARPRARCSPTGRSSPCSTCCSTSPASCPTPSATDVPREVSLQTGPLFHIGGVQALVRQLLVGGTLVFPTGRFDPTEVLDLIESEGVHRWGGVPTMVNRVLSEPSIGRRT